MRIVITGASGFVGRQMVPLLLRGEATLLLVGRDSATLRRQFPDCEAIGYEDAQISAAGYDMLVHLAVINNNQAASSDDVQQVNVELAAQACAIARAAAIGRFVLVSSVHALQENNSSDYAVSKRLAAERIAAIDGIARVVLFLPAVVGDCFSGKLQLLNKLPRWLSGVLFSMLAAVRPTVHVDVIAGCLLSGAPAPDVSPVPVVILSDGQQRNFVFTGAKRLIDIALSLVIMLLLWWAMLLVWAGIKILSPGPGLFRQLRVGRDEKPFTCLKFRTMKITAPNVATHEVSAAEVTPFGRILRRTKLDELPQALNVLKNEMSFVGSRPCLLSQSAVIAARRPRGVFHATPGITGFAQIQGLDMSDPEALAASDQEYLRLQLLVLDARIIAKTQVNGSAGDKVRNQAMRASF